MRSLLLPRTRDRFRLGGPVGDGHLARRRGRAVVELLVAATVLAVAGMAALQLLDAAVRLDADSRALDQARAAAADALATARSAPCAPAASGSRTLSSRSRLVRTAAPGSRTLHAEIAPGPRGERTRRPATVRWAWPCP